ncbi:TPA: hypothetical protein ACR3Y6_004622 [Bacillus thuringiensis]|uniref:hypothetical protein n=1 Tax=Bacillus cereus TaxID=1396 RepID=UPI002361F391|nr:hypothetical protein [Bacillus cereus]MDD0820606.1 hypothetical protein [Bacillus cereus]
MCFLTTLMGEPPLVNIDTPDYTIRHDVFKYLWLTPTAIHLPPITGLRPARD